MSRAWGFWVGLVLSLTASAGAQVVDVTTQLSDTVLTTGQAGLIQVFAQVKTPNATTGNGVFAWDVDLVISDPSVISLTPGSVDRSGWDNDGFTSSDGVAVANGLDAIYDTSFFDDSLGLGAPVQLFSVGFVATGLGTTTISIAPDLTTGADFLLHLTGQDGDYSQSSSVLTVVPEPGSGLMALALMAFCTRRPARPNSVQACRSRR